MKKLVSIYQNHKKIILITFFLILYLIGVTFIKNVGVSYDEKSEQRILEMNIMQYAKFLNKNNSLIDYYESKDIIPIYESVEKDHGIALYYPFAPILSLNLSESVVSNAWHLYTFTLFFIGIIFCYRLIKEIFKSDSVAILSTLIFYLTPKIFAASMYNNKDTILLASCFVVMFYGIKFLKDKNYRSAILLGITSAFASNLKIIGFFIFGIIGVFYLFDVTKKKEWSKQKFLVGLTAVFSCLILFILITPSIFGEGFHLIEYFKWTIGESFQFSRNYGEVWFEGKMYSVFNSLPRYYLPKIMLLTLPIYVTILFLISIILEIKTRKQNEKSMNFIFKLILTLFIIPFAIPIITKPVIYNSWRHFYFLYSFIIVIISFGLFNLFKNTKTKKITIISITIILLLNFIGIIINGPDSMAYYNILANNPAKNYEMDYYGVTAKKALSKIATSIKEPIYLYAYQCYAVEMNYNVLEKNEQEKIHLLKTEDELNNALKNGIKPYYYYSFRYNVNYEGLKNISFDNLEVVRNFKIWGNENAVLYKQI